MHIDRYCSKSFLSSLALLICFLSHTPVFAKQEQRQELEKGICAVYKGKKLLDKKSCSKSQNCKIDPDSGEANCHDIYLWPSGNKTIVSTAEGHAEAINGGRVKDSRARGKYWCITSRKTGNDFCYQATVRTKNKLAKKIDDILPPLWIVQKFCQQYQGWGSETKDLKKCIKHLSQNCLQLVNITNQSTGGGEAGSCPSIYQCYYFKHERMVRMDACISVVRVNAFGPVITYLWQNGQSTVITIRGEQSYLNEAKANSTTYNNKLQCVEDPMAKEAFCTPKP